MIEYMKVDPPNKVLVQYTNDCPTEAHLCRDRPWVLVSKQPYHLNSTLRMSGIRIPHKVGKDYNMFVVNLPIPVYNVTFHTTLLRCRVIKYTKKDKKYPWYQLTRIEYYIGFCEPCEQYYWLYEVRRQMEKGYYEHS